MNLDKILPLIQRPARYINKELNSYHKDIKNAVSICFCFPDLYEVGASNLGLEILYQLVNQKTEAVAERCYTPAADMEEILKKEHLPLFSLESKVPIKSFDVIGFSLQYELCATNILNMLNLAGLPLFAKDRDNIFPLIIGGGPVTANPEPIADFFDLFVLGDGEEVIGEIINVIKDAKLKGLSKNEILLILAKISGVYVPSLYKVDYNSDDTINSINPVSPDIPQKINKRTVKIEESFFPDRKIVPYIQTVHDRLNIEIARGCPGRCRFCQAAKYYWPFRLRSKDSIISLAQKGLESTGFEEVSFSGLSCTDHIEIDKILNEANIRFGSKRISLTVPSLRCDQFSLQIAGSLGYNKRASLTFAPEAGTDRLRNVIGKNLLGKDIEKTLEISWQMGWRLIKLYFMIGLPTETEEDIEGINTLVRSVRKNVKKLNFNITISPFVPKAQTAFQWVPMASAETLKSKIKYLEKNLPAAVKSHCIESSVLEGVMARGDRRLSKVILKAWEKGCKFDQWKEFFKVDLWNQAFNEAGIDKDFYLYRERQADEVLPWDHLVFGQDKERLLSDYKSIFDIQFTDTSKIKNGIRSISPIILPPEPVRQTIQRLRIRFGRKGMMRFLSHLEQIEVFRRTIRRANLPVPFTSGFNPQLKMSFGPAISVGYESESEYIELDLTQKVDLIEIETKIKSVLPGDFKLLSIKKIPLFFPSLDSLINLVNYKAGIEIPEQKITELLAKTEIIVEKRKKDRIENIDIRPLIKQLKNDNGLLFLQLKYGPKKNIKPEKIIQQLTGLSENDVKLVIINRTELLIEKNDGSITEP